MHSYDLPLLASMGRKVWKGAEIVLVLGLRAVGQATKRPVVWKASDRQILDHQILPAFASDARFERILFIGCDWYTQSYGDLFAGRDYWTLERDPERARFGARQHVTGDLLDLARYFENGSLDLIVCNGVLGWGLNDSEAVEGALDACASALAPGGVLILGCNDIPEKMPLPLSQVKALRRLIPYESPFGVEIRTATYNRHFFSFFQKAEQPFGRRSQPDSLGQGIERTLFGPVGHPDEQSRGGKEGYQGGRYD